MSECEKFEPTLVDYVAGALDESELGPVLTHCRDCADCRRILELHRDLVAAAAHAPEPEAAEFETLRARVVARTPGHATPAGGRQERTPGSIPWYRAVGPFPRFALAAAAAILLFVAGLTVGRGGTNDRPTGVTGGNGNVTGRLIQAINEEAVSNRELEDVENSRFTYSNVVFRPADGGRVTLDFDVTTHVRLVEPPRSEVVREVLVHSLLNPSTVGARLKAMSLAGGAMEPKVREALIFALHRDENLAVRMKALTILSEHLVEPDVKSAVVATLRDDESVQMRLLALDHLASHGEEEDHIRKVIEESPRTGDEALKVRLAEHENRL